MKADGWHWIGGGSTKSLYIDLSHQAAVNKFLVDEKSNCIQLKKDTLELHDTTCGSTLPKICTISYGGVGLGASIGKQLSESFFR